MTAATLVLTAALANWQAEIESLGGVPVLLAKVEYSESDNTLRLPADTPRRELFAHYLNQPAFATQFHQMYAAMVHHRVLDQQVYLIMLNGEKEREWIGHEEALLAHEFGHAWIKAQGYPTPRFLNDAWSCISIHTADITQHVLIRAELDRRKIDHLSFWRASIARTIAQAEKGSALWTDTGCSRAAVAAQLVDVRLGLPPQPAYEELVRRQLPSVMPVVDRLVAYLRSVDLWDKTQHRAALQTVFSELKALGEGQARD